MRITHAAALIASLAVATGGWAAPQANTADDTIIVTAARTTLPISALPLTATVLDLSLIHL
jgi:outer membrane cobalamin receptor